MGSKEAVPMRTEPEIRRRSPIDLPDGGRPIARRTAVALFVLAGLLAVAIGVAVWQAAELADRNHDIATVTSERDAAITDATASAERVSALGARVGRLEARLEATAGDEQELAAHLDEVLTELERLAGPALPDGGQFGYLAAVGAAQEPPRLVIDVAQWFTDQEAIDAAIEDGVTPWENGYYIRNEDPRWRIVEVDPAATVSLVVYPYGDIEHPRTVSLARFGELFGADEHGAFQRLPYWIRVRDATITAIEQQFIP
jgi:hypothetical protein